MKIKNAFRFFSCAIVALPLMVTIVIGWYYYLAQAYEIQTQATEAQVISCQSDIQEYLIFYSNQLSFLENTYNLAGQIQEISQTSTDAYMIQRQKNYDTLYSALKTIDNVSSNTLNFFEAFFLPQQLLYYRSPSSNIEQIVVFDPNGSIYPGQNSDVPNYTERIPADILSVILMSQVPQIHYLAAQSNNPKDHDRILFAKNIVIDNVGIIGGVALFIDADVVRNVIMKKDSTTPGRITLFSSKGEYIYKSSEHIFTSIYQLPPNNEYRSYVENVLMQNGDAIPNRPTYFHNQSGQELMLYFRGITNTDWLMTHTVATEEIATGITSPVWYLLGLTVFMLLMAMALSHQFMKYVFIPLERITTKIGRIRNGERFLRLYYPHNNEIRDLVTNFNTLVDEFNAMQKKAETRLSQRKIIMDKSDIVLFELELDSMIITFDDSMFIKTHGIPQIIHVNAYMKAMKYSVEDSEKLRIALKRLREKGTAQHIEVCIQPDGMPEPTWWTIDFLPVNDINVTHIISGVTINVTAIKQEQIRFQSLAEFDTLCNIYNRSTLFDKMDRSLENAAENCEKVAFIFIDIDDFKQFNNKYGHEFGDRIIKFIGRVIRSEVTDDIGYAGRYGGDEFILCITDQDLISCEKLLEIAEIIRNRLQVGIKTREKTSNLPILCSMGISIYPENGFLVETLLDRADKAMYHVKETGKNGIFFAKV